MDDRKRALIVNLQNWNFDVDAHFDMTGEDAEIVLNHLLLDERTCESCLYSAQLRGVEPCVSCKYNHASNYKPADDREIKAGDEVLYIPDGKKYFVLDAREVSLVVSCGEGIERIPKGEMTMRTGYRDEIVARVAEIIYKDR